MELNQPTKSYFEPMHTAEHILNGTMVKMFGCQRAFTTHIERKKSKIDLTFDRNLTETELRELEATVNAVIARGLDVTEEIISLADAATRYDLSRLPDAAGDLLRIIHVGDYDSCPCIGQHVANTSEIGAITILSSDHNDSTLRIRFKQQK